MRKVKTQIQNFRPVVLTVAGFDPSGGAGVLADCKTFEQHCVYGLAIVSGLTIQHDSGFSSVKWMTRNYVRESMACLAERYSVSVAKIGIQKNFSDVLFVARQLKNFWPQIKIVWDPVLASSSGFNFISFTGKKQLKAICSQMDLITPNRVEFDKLALNANEYPCALLLKGGHSKGKNAVDLLYQNGKSQKQFVVPRLKKSDKHGSGCVLSAAIVSNLAKGNSLSLSVFKSKKYITSFLSSNTTRSGYHKK